MRAGTLWDGTRVFLDDRNYDSAKNLFYTAFYGSDRGRRFNAKIFFFGLVAVALFGILFYILYLRFSWGSEIKNPLEEVQRVDTSNIIIENINEKTQIEQKEKEEEENIRIDRDFLRIEKIKMQHSFEIESLKNTLDLEKNRGFIKSERIDVLNNQIDDLREELRACRDITIPETIKTPLTAEELKFIEVWKKISEICKQTKTQECLDLFF